MADGGINILFEIVRENNWEENQDENHRRRVFNGKNTLKSSLLVEVNRNWTKNSFDNKIPFIKYRHVCGDEVSCFEQWSVVLQLKEFYCCV